MFNQVRMHPDDQVFHRFFWRPNDSEQARVYQWVRLNFGDKPAPDIAAAAIKNLAKALEAQHSEGAKEICTHVYVEDIGGSRENEARCKKVTRLVKSTPYSQQDNFKSKHGIRTTRTLTSQMRNVQIFLVINGSKFSTRFPLRRVKS